MLTDSHGGSFVGRVWSKANIYALIKELRTCVPKGDPFWKLEEYWTVTDQE